MAVNVDRLIHVLIEGDDEWIDLYHNNAEFHASVVVLAEAMIPSLITGLALKATVADADFKKRFAEALTDSPLTRLMP
jgi:hypothetical protein